VQGIKCYKAVPKLTGVEKPDFNDVIIQQGVDGVKAQLNSMRRIINESEKVLLGLTTQEVKPEIKKPEFWMTDDRVRLNKPLLSKIEHFITLTEQISEFSAKASRSTITKENPTRTDQIMANINKAKTEQATVAGELLKQEKLWQHIDKLKPQISIVDKLNMDIFKRDMQDNRFGAKNLQLVRQKASNIIQSQERKLQKQFSMGYS